MPRPIEAIEADIRETPRQHLDALVKELAEAEAQRAKTKEVVKGAVPQPTPHA